MNLVQLKNDRTLYFHRFHHYEMVHYKQFNYDVLKKIIYRKRAGRGSNVTCNDVIIMADTETSKIHEDTFYTKQVKVADGTYLERKFYNPQDNHVCAFTLSIRAFGCNIATLYGNKPSELVECMELVHNAMKGEQTIIYFHNMAFDYVFIRKFLFKRFGFPEKQLNTKSHYPIYMVFPNGIILKDSLILAQRSLDKWGQDLNVEHQKAKGKWDYNQIRHQNHKFTQNELEYIEHDTLCGVECLDRLLNQLNKEIYSAPYTATGIPREQVQKLAKENKFKEIYLSMCPSWEQQQKLENVYHGGFTHANRHLIGLFLTGITKCYDFASSYPYCMLAFKYPMERFTPFDDCDVDFILDQMEERSFMFRLVGTRVHLKNKDTPMPALQFSKCTDTTNAVLDNGRILCADFVSIYLTEMDLAVINEQYDLSHCMCVEVETAKKDYLPRWFTDYVFECFENKTRLKGGDPVAYALAKSIVNSLYGMTVQKPIKETLIEDYITGEFEPDENICYEDEYEKHIHKRTSVLPYQWGVWVTAYAFYNLHQLGKCIEPNEDEWGWIYSDTDSCYAQGWNQEKVDAYNEGCKQKLRANGYGAVHFNNRDYWLGVAEHDPDEDCYYQFKVMGAKRYAGRNCNDNQLHITVAGVPKKKGVNCLKDDLREFKDFKIFDGETTGKKTHTYIFKDDIEIDEYGNEVGDSIDLTPCDYLLQSIHVVDFDELEWEDIEIQYMMDED